MLRLCCRLCQLRHRLDVVEWQVADLRPVEKCIALTVLARGGAVVQTGVGDLLPLPAVEEREQDRGPLAHWWCVTDAGRHSVEVVPGVMSVWGLGVEAGPRLRCRWLVHLTAELARLNCYCDLARPAILVRRPQSCLRSASRCPGCG